MFLSRFFPRRSARSTRILIELGLALNVAPIPLHTYARARHIAEPHQATNRHESLTQSRRYLPDEMSP